MLDQLISLVKEHAGEAIVNNPAIPNEHNDAAIRETASGIFDTLKQQGGIGDLLRSGASNNPLVGQISSVVVQQLSSKFNIDAAQAGTIVQQLIPTVMNRFVEKTNDPADSSFNMDDILSTLGGSGNVLNAVKGMFGK